MIKHPLCHNIERHGARHPLTTLNTSAYLMLTISNALLAWDGDIPTNLTYGDRYFTQHDPLAESTHVFIQHNQLLQRWRQTTRFCIVELGFGTGRNFCNTLAHWEQQRRPDAYLTYIAFENAPLHRHDLQRCAKLFPTLARQYQQLLAHYPPALAGHHAINLPTEHAQLLLIYAEAQTALLQLDTKVDAWYLDGFAPQQNRDLWDAGIFQHMAQLSHATTTFSTYSAAGWVRRELRDNGFTVQKSRGFGTKKEMLHGIRTSDADTLHDYPPNNLVRKRGQARPHAAVIGAGIAGISCAAALATRGWQVSLFDTADHPASGATGNQAGIILPRLTADHNLESQFYLSAYHATLNHLHELKTATPSLQWHPSGVIQQMPSDRATRICKPFTALTQLLRPVCHTETAALCGIELEQGGIYYPNAGWINPLNWCTELLQRYAHRIDCFYAHTVNQLRWEAPEWQLDITKQARTFNADAVILANALQAQTLLDAQWLPLIAVRGQLTYLPANAASTRLTRPVCGMRYITPVVGATAHTDGPQHCIGASFSPNDLATDLRELDHYENLNQLDRGLRQAIQPTAASTLSGRAALRCASTDHLPLVGQLPQQQALLDYYQTLGGKLDSADFTHCYWPNAYISVGHGARGLTSAILSAELIASQITRAPAPMAQSLVQVLHPGRFLLRNAKRGKFY